jgi:ribosomal protein L11 methyltransferase
MPFLQVSLDIGAADPAPFEDALFAAGAISVTMRDSADDPIFEPAPGATPLWATVTVSALFTEATARNDVIESLRHIGKTLPRHHFETIEDRVWEREWLKDFKPMQFGKRLWVCPNNMQPPADVFAVTVQLDPGLAFGTGTHPTTALCLEWLDSAVLEHKTMIDYGCGSGILAIAALKLGAQSVIGIDVDQQALLASRENAERNGVSSRLSLQSASAKAPPPCHVLVANILAEPLDELAPTLANLVLPGGDLVLSGILKTQATGLAHRYATWFDMDVPVYREDWARLTGKRQ